MVLTSLNKYRDHGLLILRLGMGAMFLFHGLPKLLGGPEFWAKIGTAVGFFGIHFLPAFWGFMAACAESLGGGALIAGFLFRPACLFLVINLVVASSSHLARGQGLGGASHAIEDGIVFLALIFIGAGRFSLDEIISSRRGANP
jgi:putative oxidoreductase